MVQLKRSKKGIASSAKTAEVSHHHFKALSSLQRTDDFQKTDQYIDISSGDDEAGGCHKNKRCRKIVQLGGRERGQLVLSYIIQGAISAVLPCLPVLVYADTRRGLVRAVRTVRIGCSPINGFLGVDCPGVVVSCPLRDQFCIGLDIIFEYEGVTIPAHRFGEIRIFRNPPPLDAHRIRWSVTVVTCFVIVLCQPCVSGFVIVAQIPCPMVDEFFLNVLHIELETNSF